MARLSSAFLSMGIATLSLGGCGGAPASEAMPDTVHQLLRASGDVQYISDFSNGTVTEFDYPNDTSPIGQITGVSDANGECNIGSANVLGRRERSRSSRRVQSGRDEAHRDAHH